MRFGITVSFATLAIVLATNQQVDNNAAHNSLLTRQSKSPASGAGGSDAKLQGDPKTCSSLIKMIEGCKSGGGAAPKTRRHLSESGSNDYPLTRRAPPGGDSKAGAGASASDSCSKLAAMANKKPQGSGSPPKPKGPSSTPPAASTTAAPSRRDLIHNVEHNSLSTRQNKPPSSGGGGDGKLTGDPKTCSSLIKMVEGCKSGGGGAPKTRRDLSGSDDSHLTRRAPQSGDSKSGAGAAASDPCSKLAAMANKKPPGSGSPPKTKDASSKPPAAATEAAPSRRDLIHNVEHNSLSTRQNKAPASSGSSGSPDNKLQGDSKLCAAIIKMIEGNKSGAGGPTASPKTRRALSGSDSSSLVRRAPPSGDNSKTGTAATDADACAKLQAMAKKAQGSGSSPPNAPKPKPGSTTTSSAPPNASPKAAPSRS
ncbi:uncharacterized protein MELLADRAFT_62407 [Melampsora larici-populina 98AG31]|uniref:Secreted protein n=1 Tax=Melampsora larici-populina (strain 98AG31 / pathotype 3-4-7) TaxID=747676 RepID=F4RIV2_MELLP|nr:uncharacterized protein MELLADRAFT_62407 [Melampsora larici-populina 98AG31]EGG07626.1 hypothetical protein MELLADRAFT_62407 [Melampsora larici-populina 98AG31]